jgi:hypothetical protein
MTLAIHFVFIVLSSYNNLTYDANPAYCERFRPLFAGNGVFAGNPFWGNVTMVTHPLHTLGFEPLLSSLVDLGFEPATPVGLREPASGRKIVQPTDNPTINQALATNAMPAYKARLEAAIRHIPGATLAASRNAKNPRRLAEKIVLQGQPAETVSDYGAAQIAVDTTQAKDAVVAAVRQHFKVLREHDNFTAGDPEYHYRSFSLQLQMPNGASEELQIVPRPVLEVNRKEHHDYKKARNAELEGEGAGPARATARAINDRAMDHFNSKNGVSPQVAKGAVVKGSRVRLTDGAVARIVYVDPNMRIARVRTEDGRNITVRHKDLRRS